MLRKDGQMDRQTNRITNVIIYSDRLNSCPSKGLLTGPSRRPLFRVSVLWLITHWDWASPEAMLYHGHVHSQFSSKIVVVVNCLFGSWATFSKNSHVVYLRQWMAWVHINVYTQFIELFRVFRLMAALYTYYTQHNDQFLIKWRHLSTVDHLVFSTGLCFHMAPCGTWIFFAEWLL